MCSDALAWDDARAACQADFAADLAKLDDQAEYEAIVALLQEQGAGNWYIGLSDIEQEGDFRWLDGSPPAFTAWAEAQPDDASGEDCGEIRTEFAYEWNDAICSTTKGYICEAGPA